MCLQDKVWGRGGYIWCSVGATRQSHFHHKGDFKMRSCEGEEAIVESPGAETFWLERSSEFFHTDLQVFRS